MQSIRCVLDTRHQNGVIGNMTQLALEVAMLKAELDYTPYK